MEKGPAEVMCRLDFERWAGVYQVKKKIVSEGMCVSVSVCV